MIFQPAGWVSLTCFLLVVAGVLTAFGVGVFCAGQRLGQPPWKFTLAALARVAVGLLCFSLIVASGAPRSVVMPLVPLLFLAINVAAVWLAFSPLGGALAAGISMEALILFQVFRLPLELVLHVWAREGVIPEMMTWTGQNFDLLTGLISALSFRWAGRSWWGAMVINSIGLLLLLNVMRVVVLTSPLPFTGGVQPPLQLIFYLPYALIAPVCVGGALAGHLILFRKLAAVVRARRAG